MFIGGLYPWQKGLDLLIEAFARAALPKTALVLVRPDLLGSRSTLEKLGQRFGISSHLLFWAGIW
jgi:hypothetical protein